MALMKPGFYMLAKHGPWEHHVRVANTDVMDQAIMWLARQGKAQDIDYEVLVEKIEHKNTKKVFAPLPVYQYQPRQRQQFPPLVQSMEPIIFFNDAKLASYVKLTWG